MYLKSAQWGFDELLTKKLSGYAFRFYSIGILASLRAVQHALMNHDSTLSDEHGCMTGRSAGFSPLRILAA
jgi:hypothetical protein